MTMMFNLLGQNKKKGFTLAELLISLAVLGVIATFTIPKVLNASQDGQWNSAAKEVSAMVFNAYEAYRLNNTVEATTTVGDITPYMNFVQLDTSSVIDHVYGHVSTTRDCSITASSTCLKLFSGGILRMAPLTGVLFCAPSASARWFQYDPDGVVTDAVPTATGAGKAVGFLLYPNGRLTTYDHALNPTCGNASTVYATGTPSWFSW